MLERQDVREAIDIAIPIAIVVSVVLTVLSGGRSPAHLALGAAVIGGLLLIGLLHLGPLRRRPHVVALAFFAVIVAGRFVPIYVDLGVPVLAHAYFGLIVITSALFLPWSGRWHLASLAIATSAYGLAILTVPELAPTRVPGASLAITAGLVSIAGNRLVRTRRQRTLAGDLALRDKRAALRTAQAQLELLAHEDALTGLANRRRLNEDIVALEARLTRGLPGVSAVMIDLDRFKAYNDAVGHPTADRTLRDTAAAIQQAVRAADRVYRYGGEEILVLLEEDASGVALAVAERIVAAVRELHLRHPANPGGIVTVSAGAAGSDGRAVGPWIVIDEADRALYDAKAAGRDRAVVSVHPRTAAPVGLTLAS